MRWYAAAPGGTTHNELQNRCASEDVHETQECHMSEPNGSDMATQFGAVLASFSP